MPKRKVVHIGDVVEVATPRGLRYAEFVGIHPLLQDTIYVFDDLHAFRPANLETILSAQGFYAFYPLRASVKQGLTEVVISLPSSRQIGVPNTIRRAGVRAGGKVLTWIIENNCGRIVKKELTADEKTLPIGIIWDHHTLVTCLANEWRPSHEG